MLSSLTLKNFKPFENQSFSLKPLTLLAGLNSTSKHDPSGYWKNATPMNLKDQEAQKVLNSSVCNSNENSEKRYGFHKETDQFYVFHSDNTFDEQGYPTYHGFPIPEDQVPKEVLNKIKR
ncbi:hypothetical protein H6F47_26830 [Sphaerospermopsis sp. FACHB-1094]|uniref:hypothetical protein n=1 Tax=Sphaerospermopsis sp. FACHB-1094 TaxID=2692861 RepID=UPI0016846FD7|nr:hypothetical protein [Sphaerospermopsis sp. FACHB-1094]MBD2135915.1 hypothetical protein [Sphaerospermopsis sp. FACHB-1094]